MTEYLPHYKSFVELPVYIGLLLTLALSFIAPVFLPLSYALGIVAVLWVLFSFFAAQVRAECKKTRLVFLEDKIIFYSGGLFSGTQTTLLVRNITQIRLVKPFVRNRLFGTSSLHIKAAGIQGVGISLNHFLLGEQAYTNLYALLQKNGFSLKKKELLHERTPVVAAIILQNLFAVGVFFFALVASFGALIINLGFGLLIGFVVVLSACVFVLHIVDSIYKKYVIYNDALEYSEGFLTQVISVIPAENLAAAASTQTVIERLLDVRSIEVHTQGTGTLSFPFIGDGLVVEQTIDGLAKKYSPLLREKISESNLHAHAHKKQRVHTEKSSSVSKSYSQNVPRAVATIIVSLMSAFTIVIVYAIIDVILLGSAPSVLFLGIGLFIVFISTWVPRLIEMLCTRYEIRSQGIYSEYSFLSRSVKEFSDNKLVGVQIKRSVLDQIMGTASFEFMSLSSAPNIVFKHIKDVDSVLFLIREKYSLDSAFVSVHTSSFSVRSLILRYMPAYIFLGLAVLIASFFFIYAILLAGIILGVFVLSGFLRYRQSHISLFSEHIEHRVGFFVITHTLVRYQDIKYQEASRYRFCSDGELYISIGGVSGVETDTNQQTPGYSNGFTVRYIQQSHELLDTIDKTLGCFSRNQVVSSSLRSKKTASVRWLLGSLFLLGAPIVLLPVWLYVVSRYYYVREPSRLVQFRSVWNVKKRSVLFSNIDHVGSAQTVSNKLFRTGSVQVFTVGSLSADIILYDLPDYTQWKKDIELVYS